MKEERYLIKYVCFLFNTRIEGTEGSVVVWADSSRPPQVGDYEDFVLGGLTVQKCITEVMKVTAES